MWKISNIDCSGGSTQTRIFTSKMSFYFYSVVHCYWLLSSCICFALCLCSLYTVLSVLAISTDCWLFSLLGKISCECAYNVPLSHAVRYNDFFFKKLKYFKIFAYVLFTIWASMSFYGTWFGWKIEKNSRIAHPKWFKTIAIQFDWWQQMSVCRQNKTYWNLEVKIAAPSSQI